MLRFVLAAFWVSAVTLAAVFYSFQLSQARSNVEAPPPFFGGLDYVRANVMSVPVMRQGNVDGYFLTRLVYTAEPAKLNALSVPADILLLDHLHSYLYGNPQIDFSELERIDLDALRNGIRDSINERLGEKLVHEVLVEQIDYLSKADIRDNAIRRRLNRQE
ncbi:hypothetical protein [Chelativorans sp. Marseille-P2723]|uniref:hypothetical protein n=1 Tax=Chelativorans sp. Marseille-P2723 TaxID=2709133 RepID=UPI00156EE91A|nr:hypothetical protein [Chelativorans sp. Marseille-P2723]